MPDPIIDPNVDPAPAPTDPAPVDPAPVADPAPVDPSNPDAVDPNEEPELFELPDGRKVDGATLATEWKENFAPEFTRKSQRLAEYENINNPNKDVPAWKQDGYVPQSYGEIIELAKSEVHKEIAQKHTEDKERQDGIQTQVTADIVELKKADPNLNEDLLFQHANKYGFTSLKTAYGNMKDMKLIVQNTEKKTIKNINGRATDPINTGGGDPDVDNSYDPVANSQFSGAVDFLNRLNK